MDLNSFSFDNVVENSHEGWKTITITDVSEPMESKSGKGINIFLYYMNNGKEKKHCIHLNPENATSYSININLIASIASNVMKLSQKDTLALIKAKTLSLSDAFNKMMNLEVEAFFGKQKDSDFYEIKKFLAFGEIKRDEKPAVKKSIETDLPF
jgi:hypothetical protein